jgi:protein-tyrosine-phosphatase
MAELGVDLSGNVPREMDGTEVRDRDLPDPHGASVERVHEIREEVRERVSATFDELDAEPARTD